MIEKITGLILLLSLPFGVRAQSGNADSLFGTLNGVTATIIMVDSLNKLSEQYRYKSPDSTIFFAQQALVLSRKLKYTTGEMNAFSNLGDGYFGHNDYPHALSYFLRALAIADQQADDWSKAGILNDIGSVHYDNGNFDKALSYYDKALELARKSGNNYRLDRVLGCIGNVYMDTGDFAQALKYKQESLSLSVSRHDHVSIATDLCNICMIYSKQKDYTTALNYCQKSYALSLKINDLEGLAFTSLDIAEVYFNQHKYDQAIKQAENGLLFARKLKSNKLILRGYEILSQICEAQKNFADALKYYKQFVVIQDSTFSMEKEKLLKEMQTDYDLNKKQQEIDLLYEKQTRQEDQLQSQSIQRNVLILGLTLIALVALLFWINLHSRKKINALLSQENELVRSQKEEIMAQKQEIAVQNQQLEAVNATKDKLFSIISHDLRSPLHTLQGTLDLLREGALTDEEISEITGLLYKKVRHTSDLIDNLLNWAMSQMEGLRMSPEEVDLYDLVQANLELFMPQAAEKGIVLENHIGMPVQVWVDKNMMLLVLRNLLNNAIKFTHVNGSVSILSQLQDDKVIICVQDTGIGIDSDRIEKLFKELSVFTTNGTLNEKGTGLGLLLCKDFVEKNGGTIWVESNPAKGARFCFTVPLVFASSENYHSSHAS